MGCLATKRKVSDTTTMHHHHKAASTKQRTITHLTKQPTNLRYCGLISFLFHLPKFHIYVCRHKTNNVWHLYMESKHIPFNIKIQTNTLSFWPNINVWIWFLGYMCLRLLYTTHYYYSYDDIHILVYEYV